MLNLRRLKQRLAPPLPPGAPSAQGAAPVPPAAGARPALEPAVNFQQAMGRDEVTGLPNRARFTHLLCQQAALAAQFEAPLSVLVIGWPAYADEDIPAALRNARLGALAARMRDTLHRRHDMLGSLGAGRVAVMLPFTEAAGAMQVVANLRHAVRDELREELPTVSLVPAIADDAPARTFGQLTAGAADTDAGAMDAAAREALGRFTIGHASYCGKGALDAAALLASAEDSSASTAQRFAQDAPTA